MRKEYELNSKVILYPGMAGWHFVSVNKKASQGIKEKHGKNQKRFGSVPVEVTVGTTIWDTSIFPDKMSRTYLLPLKASVRNKEGILDGDDLNFGIQIR